MKKSRAFSLIRSQPHYRKHAFTEGLKRAGYQVFESQPGGWGPVNPGDVLVIWNRYGLFESLANDFERSGGLVLVAENGYIGHDADGIQHYAMAAHQHNGAGVWPTPEHDRFAALGIEVKPWQRNGNGHVFIRGQRGIGSRSMASPPAWHHQTAERIKRHYPMQPVVCLDHPGKPACDPGVTAVLRQRLDGAVACVIWSSGVGVRALVEGVPVFYSAPHWICEEAARPLRMEGLQSPLEDDALRLRALQSMAWAQWTVAELQGGEPFVRVIEAAREKQKAVA